MNIPQELAIKLYKNMLLYRKFEEKVFTAYTQQKFSGFCHLHIGQEAVCAGLQACLQDEDYVISGYRSHTQALAKGLSPREVFSEILGKVTGCSRGKGGSMHMFSKEKRFFGGHGIVGGQVPLALGMGFAIKYKKEKSLVVCYLGDGAMSQGAVFESMNMAALWNLPILFLLENNRYAMGTSVSRSTLLENLHKRADAFPMENAQMDGMNIFSVLEKSQEILPYVRDKGPFLLEALTYRFKGHSVSDPGQYRTHEEMLFYKNLDPIKQMELWLSEKGWLGEASHAWEQEIRSQVNKAFEEAEQDPYPTFEELEKHVYEEDFMEEGYKG